VAREEVARLGIQLWFKTANQGLPELFGSFRTGQQTQHRRGASR